VNDCISFWILKPEIKKKSDSKLILENFKTNLRTDEFGGTPEKRARFILEIIRKTRAVVPKSFAIGIKLNSADHSSSTFEETMTQISLVVDAGIDFMEISGGTYESPDMMGYPTSSPEAKGPAKSERTAAREAFFLEFAKTVRERHPKLILMLTGGFRTRAGCVAAIEDGACDLVGIGRPAAIEPAFPLLLLDEGVKDEKAVMPLSKVPVPWYAGFLPRNLIGAGAESVSIRFAIPGSLFLLIFCLTVRLVIDLLTLHRLIMLCKLSVLLRDWLLMRQLCEEE